MDDNATVKGGSEIVGVNEDGSVVEHGWSKHGGYARATFPDHVTYQQYQTSRTNDDNK